MLAGRSLLVSFLCIAVHLTSAVPFKKSHQSILQISKSGQIGSLQQTLKCPPEYQCDPENPPDGFYCSMDPSFFCGLYCIEKSHLCNSAMEGMNMSVVSLWESSTTDAMTSTANYFAPVAAASMDIKTGIQNPIATITSDPTDVNSSSSCPPEYACDPQDPPFGYYCAVDPNYFCGLYCILEYYDNCNETMQGISMLPPDPSNSEAFTNFANFTEPTMPAIEAMTPPSLSPN